MIPRGLLGLLLLSLPVTAAEWDERLARKFSGRLAEVEKELSQIAEKLPELPVVPVADQGGTGGFASLHPQAVPEQEGDFAVEVRWAEPAEIDLVALVPARRYGVGGLEPQFGMPDEFTVELLDQEGAVVGRIAEERDLWADPVRAGHPFMFEVSPPLTASALRLAAGRLRLDSDISDSYVHAWAEAFVFSGERNLAAGAEVGRRGGQPPGTPWQWADGFLIDGMTPLGLPEMPAGPHANVGWISEGRPDRNKSVRMNLELGEPKSFDALRLFPAKRPTSDLPAGFGFPRRMSVLIDGRTFTWEGRNPGHNPVLIPLEPQQASKITLEVTELWKDFESYPAFVALSEIEVLDDGTNVAVGAVMRSPDGMGAVVAAGQEYWNATSLTDGFGPEGRLVPWREWLGGLDRRLRLEQRQHALREEAGAIMDGWRRTGLSIFALLGAAGAVALVALPLRYRAREKRELKRVRERIASDLHDEVGSNLGSIQMFADVAAGRAGDSEELKRIQRIAAETVSAVRDIVWLLRPSRDHRIGTIEHLRETGSIMLERLDWEFTADEAAWQVELPDEANRHLFLYFREALHNVLRHAKATRVTIRAEAGDGGLRLVIRDDGCGIAPERLERPATLRALRQRSAALGGELRVESGNGGTTLELRVPMEKKTARGFPKAG